MAVTEQNPTDYLPVFTESKLEVAETTRKANHDHSRQSPVDVGLDCITPGLF